MYQPAESIDPFANNETLVQELANCGWSIVEDYLPAAAVRSLTEECLGAWQQGTFHHAGVGRGEQRRIRPEIRSDQVMWVDPDHPTPGQAVYFSALEDLRQRINRSLYLGLFELESHFAVYPPGAFYKRHLDRFRGVEERTVTCVFYLNEGWQVEDGGALRFYTREQPEEYFDVLPTAGKLVTFLSGEYYHEVLPANRRRLSLTGWFKVRS